MEAMQARIACTLDMSLMPPIPLIVEQQAGAQFSLLCMQKVQADKGCAASSTTTTSTTNWRILFIGLIRI